MSNDHVSEIAKKASKRLYFLSQLKRSKVVSSQFLSMCLATHRVRCHKILIDLPSNLFVGITTVKTSPRLLLSATSVA